MQYTYTKIKTELFENGVGIKEYPTYRMAMPERALCDYLYLYPRATLDNPEIFNTPTSIARFKKFLPFYPRTTQNTLRKLLKLQDI